LPLLSPTLVQSVKKLPHFVIRDIKNQAQGESCSNIHQLSCIWLDGQRWMNGYPLRHPIQDFVRCECIAKKNILILIRLTLMYRTYHTTEFLNAINIRRGEPITNRAFFIESINCTFLFCLVTWPATCVSAITIICKHKRKKNLTFKIYNLVLLTHVYM
jgi:hypothetical protein